MARAVRLAAKGLYTTDPNPRVGCLVVREGVVIGEGWHQKAGEAHAEVNALNQAGSAAEGATAYVTLEPCSHHGKTPPCAEALIKAKVTRVVVAMQDPNPQVSGSGIGKLKAAGIEVCCGLLESEAEALNPGFCKRMQQGLPFIRSKLAMSLDGRTAMASGESKWITGADARRDVHRLRARSSAMLTGVQTVLVDDPLLTARLESEEEVKQPWRVIVDSQLQMNSNAAMGRLSGKTLLLTTLNESGRRKSLEAAGFEVVVVSEQEGHIDLHESFQLLASYGVNEVMVEAGAVLNGALLKAGLVDEWIIYMAPCVMGSTAKGLFELPGLESMADRFEMKLKETRMVGADLRLTFQQLKR
jgi:diaminohydroxyphosphoribosylaminopyrimidine deaminase/5-amino-6-(5-phosphoribosylamino)uracil reductase